MTRAARSASAGFTLLEILIAFTIATTSLGLLFRIHANSTATVVLSAEYQGATALAQALIAELSVTERSLSFTRTGSSDNYNWTVRADAYAGETVAAGAHAPPYLLRSIVAEVRWISRDRDRSIELLTIKPFYAPEP